MILEVARLPGIRPRGDPSMNRGAVESPKRRLIAPLFTFTILGARSG